MGRSSPALPLVLLAALAAQGCAGEVTCPAGTQRIDGSCQRPGGGSAQARCGPAVVINEVLYDPEGNEGQGKAFLELKGPTGTVLDGWQLTRVRSTGAEDGLPLELAGTIGAAGYLVIGESESVQGDYQPQIVAPSVDGANNAFSFLLICREDTVDAMAYGVWAGDPPGEGGAAPKAPEGKSLSRCPDGVDTGDNSGDFRPAEVTPGMANSTCPPPPPECPAGAVAPAAGDVVVNEVAMRPISTDDLSTPEFIEVVNTRAGPVDLSGYRLAWNPGTSRAFNQQFPLPPETCLDPAGSLVLWGDDGGPGAPGILVLPYGSKLQVRDSEGAVHLLAPDDTDLGSLCYGSGECARARSGSSLTRDPDLTGEPVPHAQASHAGGAAASPGTCQNGDPFSSGCDRLPPGPPVDAGQPDAGVADTGVEDSGGAPEDTGPPPPPPCDEEVPPGVVINEVGFDPVGDTNADGDPSSTHDEFVELLNTSPAAVDVTGWTLSDLIRERIAFPEGTVIPAGGALVVLVEPDTGCPAPGLFAGNVGHVCSGVLQLNNVESSNDTVTLALPDGSGVDVVAYGPAVGPCVERARADQSFVRSPDGGPHWVPHLEANPDLAESPGRRTDGSAF